MPNQSKDVPRLLLDAFERKRERRRGYSRTAFARDIGVSPAFVSRLFSGEKRLPLHRLKKICHVLELDAEQRAALVQAAALDPFSAKILGAIPRSSRRFGARKAVNLRSGELLEHWWIIPLLIGIGMGEGTSDEIDQVGERLGLSATQLAHALRQLKRANVICERDGRLVAIEPHFYAPTGRSMREVRAFHLATLDHRLYRRDLARSRRADESEHSQIFE